MGSDVVACLPSVKRRRSLQRSGRGTALVRTISTRLGVRLQYPKVRQVVKPAMRSL